MNEAFDKYIQKVKLLNINGKRKELYDSITDFGKGLIDIASSDNIPITNLIVVKICCFTSFLQNVMK